MNKRFVTFICFLVFSMLGLVLLKVHIQHLYSKVEKMSDTKEDLTKQIQVLRAEMSFLERPDRIRVLAEKHLSLQGIEAQQIKSFQEVPTGAQSIAENTRQVSSNWRYKSRSSVLKIANVSTKLK